MLSSPKTAQQRCHSGAAAPASLIVTIRSTFISSKRLRSIVFASNSLSRFCVLSFAFDLLIAEDEELALEEREEALEREELREEERRGDCLRLRLRTRTARTETLRLRFRPARERDLPRERLQLCLTGGVSPGGASGGCGGEVWGGGVLLLRAEVAGEGDRAT